MKYDFETVMNRDSDCLAAELIPFSNIAPAEGVKRIDMWVADMSFPTAPCIKQAIINRVNKSHFGYFKISDEYYNSIIAWQKRRNNVEDLTKDCIGYENGVLGGVSSAVQTLSCPGEKLLVHSPTYVGFTHTMADNGRVLVHSELKRDENGIWRMDFDDMDRKIKENNIRIAIFCSPHNPTGRVWERWEIEKAMEIYKANNCYVISDEIWSDIIMPGNKHIPTQSISEDARSRVVAFYSPSKTFSLAGLIGSYHIIYNEYIRTRIRRFEASGHYNDCNVLSMHALISALGRDGEEWAEEMVSAISKNVDYACDFINKNFQGVKVMKPQGTYMLYLDCVDWCNEHGVTISELQKRGVEAGVIWQNGETFVYPNTIRMNLALPHCLMVEAFERLKDKAFI